MEQQQAVVEQQQAVAKPVGLEGHVVVVLPLLLACLVWPQNIQDFLQERKEMGHLSQE